MKVKRIIILTIALLLCLNSRFVILADEIDEELDYDFIYGEIEESIEKSTNGPNILSKTVVAYDRKSKKILWGKQENLKVPMASTTKIMTAIILLENGNLNETVTVDKKAAGIGGSRLGIGINDKITLNDLLYGLMLCSR